MILIPKKDEGTKKPHYIIWRGRVMLTCPYGHIASLNDHEIGSDGVVKPSVMCPEEGCKFHAFVKLEDWK